ncbi:hypothetical protein F511_05174 [Dorcoceras hygrometricum]|uniref:Uncharacterized protein n=1 Tax=Dorcoceras hygrometricum TaxID=472368 RepID=A0A2Z7C353_9LAMI|nr:hypothetical protein F511_05174 [Dorcoceras hygrometricum]
MDSHIVENASPFSYSVDDISKQHICQFANSLKDFKNLREQLYSAAEYFESSYVKENHKHFLVEGSKDYVARALVHTVDHLGSVADKLNKFLDDKAKEFSDTSIRFSSIQQDYLCSRRLCQISQIKDFAERLQSMSGIWQAPTYAKKGQSRISSPGNSPISEVFSYSRVLSDGESVRCSAVSPLRLLRRWSTIPYRSTSPNPSSRGTSPLEPRRAISVCRRSEMRNQERDVESYVQKSSHVFEAFLNRHQSRQEL